MTRGVALIIPVLNEGETIAAVVRAVPRDVVDEVIVVDGGSADDTVARAKNAGARVIVEPRSGYGAACVTGSRSRGAREKDSMGFHQLIAGTIAFGQEAPRSLLGASETAHRVGKDGD